MTQTLTEAEWKAIEDKAQRLWEETLERRPVNADVGFFAYGDAPGGIGGGVGSFTWFEDQEQMWNFIQQVLPFNPPGTSDPLETQKLVIDAIERHRSGEILLEHCRKSLNIILRSYSQIEWFGTFADLRSGNDHYAAKVIACFREPDDADDEEVGSCNPISEDEVDDFIDFLDTYGI